MSRARGDTPSAGGPSRACADARAAPRHRARCRPFAAASSDAEKRSGTPAAPRRRGDPGASGPLRADAAGSPVSLRDLLESLDLHPLVCDDPLERRVLALELLQALDVVRLHPAVLRAPAVERVLRDLELLGDLGDRLAFRQQPLGLAQLANDLLRRVPASLHLSSFLAHDRRRAELSQAPDRTQGVGPGTP